MAPILLAGLPRAGLARTFPRDILYGPTKVQGFGVIHPWYHQQLLHLIALLKHTQQHTMTGQLLSTSYEQLRLEMGTPGFITDTPFQIVKSAITHTWITDLWNFLDRFQIKIQDNVGQLRLQRQNDKFIMEEFIKANVDGNELKQLNECRMFLNVVTLSDIATADGSEITINAWEGQKEDRGGSQYQWPRTQQALSADHWKLWRRTLTKAFLATGPPRKLQEKLHAWRKGLPTKWKWYFSPEED
jgi:hypothetical protein